jgi:hypothetical protein
MKKIKSKICKICKKEIKINDIVIIKEIKINGIDDEILMHKECFLKKRKKC